jgi:hypothetical protein
MPGFDEINISEIIVEPQNQSNFNFLFLSILNKLL